MNTLSLTIGLTRKYANIEHTPKSQQNVFHVLYMAGSHEVHIWSTVSRIRVFFYFLCNY